MFILERYHNYIFIGGSGSGKTELSVNTAIQLAASEANKQICFFDMDQTKGMFRSRDLRLHLLSEGVLFLDTVDYMDAPVVPAGISSSLSDTKSTCVFDVGGNVVGAKMIGQYAAGLAEHSTCAFYVLNPFRPFSGTWDDIYDSMKSILNASKIPMERVRILSNPCLGERTSPFLILQAHNWLSELLKKNGLQVAALATESSALQLIQSKVSCPVLSIRLFVKQLYQG
ncbi:hypothetical protein AGMMS49983_19770 [Clostridia bacterium]|nr:hypothetical protein AGMMS49983_19770 [Clostridia bacterium]